LSRLRFSRRWLFRLAGVLLVTGLIAPHVWAWTRLRAARTALAAYHPETARQELTACQRVWGWDGRVSVRLLAAQAARQDGDLLAASAELRAAQNLLGGASDATAFEWALLQASAGNVREVEEYLQRRADQSPDAAPLVWEALTEGYLRVYRTLDAMACVNHWLGRDPNNPRALELRGQTYVTGKGVVRGADDYRRVLELDPMRRQTRWRLIVCLMDLGGYQEAAGHLELFVRDTADDPKAVAMLARCYNFVGRRAEARQILDAALARHPDDGTCLRTRGQLALMDDQKVEAERWLRRAADILPDDYQSQWLLYEALRQQGKLDEAREQNRRADAVKDRAARLSELQSRKLAEFPLDPALHYEMGALLIQTGHGEIGERWLLTALDLDAGHQPSHAALAAYYEGRGDRAKAELHRGRAAGKKE
jgi:predicted Zn-dependent protease